MKPVYKLILIGCLTIGLFDALLSVLSKQLNFNYAYLALMSYIIYGTFGFLGTKKQDLKTGIWIAAIIGLFDSTVGWEISILLKANTGSLKNDPTLGMWIFTSLFVTAIAALAGVIGGWLAKITTGKSMAA